MIRKIGPPIRAIWRPVPRYCADFPNIRVHQRISDALTLRCTQQMSSRYVQINQPAGHEQPVGVLAQTAVTDLVEAEDTLEGQERVFDSGPDFGLGAVLRAFNVPQDLVAVSLLFA